MEELSVNLARILNSIVDCNEIVEGLVLVSSLNDKGATTVGPAGSVHNIILKDVEAQSSSVDIASIISLVVFEVVHSSLKDGENGLSEVEDDLSSELVGFGLDLGTILLDVLLSSFSMSAFEGEDVEDELVDLVSVHIDGAHAGQVRADS